MVTLTWDMGNSGHGELKTAKTMSSVRGDLAGCQRSRASSTDRMVSMARSSRRATSRFVASRRRHRGAGRRESHALAKRLDFELRAYDGFASTSRHAHLARLLALAVGDGNLAPRQRLFYHSCREPAAAARCGRPGRGDRHVD